MVMSNGDTYRNEDLFHKADTNDHSNGDMCFKRAPTLAQSQPQGRESCSPGTKARILPGNTAEVSILNTDVPNLESLPTESQGLVESARRREANILPNEPARQGGQRGVCRQEFFEECSPAAKIPVTRLCCRHGARGVGGTVGL